MLARFSASSTKRKKTNSKPLSAARLRVFLLDFCGERCEELLELLFVFSFSLIFKKKKK